MNLSFDLYRVFYYVCKYMSITEAAKNLYVSQPAITKQIKNLEDGISRPLFIRTKKGLELTEDGQKLYDRIKEPVEAMMEIEEKKDNDKFLLNIVAGYSTIKSLLLKSITKFNENHPNVSIEVNTYCTKDSLERLSSGKADLVFIDTKNDMVENYSKFKVKDFTKIHDIFVVSSTYNDAPKELKLLEINNYPIICKNHLSMSRRNIDEYLERHSINFSPKYELTSNWLVEEYVLMNKGIGIVTKEFCEEELASGKFIELKTDISLPPRELGYATRIDTPYAKVIDDFINDAKLSINSIQK